MNDLPNLIQNILNNFRIYKEAKSKLKGGKNDSFIKPSDANYLSSNSSTDSYTFFENEEFTIDYVLVYKISALQSKQAAEFLSMYLANLEESGIQINTVPHEVNYDLMFIHLYAPRNILVKYAKAYDIHLSFETYGFLKVDNRVWPECMENDLERYKNNPDLMRRIPKHVYGERPINLLSKERIIILHHIMQRAKFGPHDTDIGCHNLLANKVLEAAYPLHETEWRWTDEGLLNHRQLLMKCWANYHVWCKVQPIDLINMYFGAEAAFYFAWVGLYNKMLIYACIISFLVLLYGLITLYTDVNKESKEFCNSNIIMCPRCGYTGIQCTAALLKDSCLNSRISYLLDNSLTIFYAIFISCWSTLFIELWQRRQIILLYHWDLLHVQIDNRMRPEYPVKTKYRRISQISGKLEPYVPFKLHALHLSTSYICVIIMIIIVIFAVVGLILFRLTLEMIIIKSTPVGPKRIRYFLFAHILASMVYVIFMIIFEKTYNKISISLTNLENPRTLLEFHNSYIYKRFVLYFFNAYSPFFYIAVVKGRFMSHPGNDYKQGLNIFADNCRPPSCVIDLAIQLFIIIFFKSMIFNLKQILIPILKSKKHKKGRTSIPQWEEEYVMCGTDQFYLVDEYMEMVIQYGFITFFVAAFPIGPILALLNNVIELRTDAYKLTRLYRRPVPRRVANLGAWLGLQHIMTYIGVFINALIIAFRTNAIPRIVYFLYYDVKLTGFHKYRLSEFSLKDFQHSSNINLRGASSCYYKGMRNGPGHKDKYSLSQEFWYLLTVSLLFMLLFEIIMVLLKCILLLIVTEVPFYIKEQLRKERHELRELKLKTLEDHRETHNERNETFQTITV